MKIKLLLLVAVVGFTFASCESFKDLASVDVETEMKVDVPLEDVAASLKSAALAGNEIKGSASISLTENEDVKDYVEGIRNMTVVDPIGTFTSMNENDEITNLVVTATLNSVEYEVLNEAGPITLANAEVALSSTNVNSLIDALSSDYGASITFDVSGQSKELVGNRLKLKLKLPSTVSYSPL